MAAYSNTTKLNLTQFSLHSQHLYTIRTSTVSNDVTLPILTLLQQGHELLSKLLSFWHYGSGFFFIILLTQRITAGNIVCLLKV